MKILKRTYPYLLILFIVLIFFKPIFNGQIPFPGDLLINQNPYRSESFLGYSPGSYPDKAQGPDVINEIYPWKYFSIEQLKNGQIPFWNPHNFSGNPQMANFQTAVFYPLNLFYLFLPFNFAWTLFIMSQPFFAAIFMFIYLNKGLRLQKTVSVIGGIAFAFSSYMVVWIEYGNIGSTFLWLPLALFLINKLTEQQNYKNVLSLIIIFTLSLLAGYIQGVFYAYSICLLYFLFLLFSQKVKAKIKKTIIFLSILFFPFILSAFQFLPTLEIFKNSTRGSYALEQFSKTLSPIYYWITIIFPDFFGNPASRNYWIDGTYIERVMYPGVVIFFFAVYAILKVKKPEKKFFGIIAALSLIIATNIPFIKYFYLLPIPVISTTIPTRELCIFIFSIIVLGAMGINYWIEEKNLKSKYPLFFILAILLFSSAAFLIYKAGYITDNNFKISIRNMLLPSFLTLATLIIFYLKNKFKNISLVFVLLLIIFDLLYFFNKITPFSPYSFTYPNTPVMNYLQENAGINRFWGYGSGYIQSNYQSVDGTYSPEGNDPLHISSYGELLASSKYGELPNILPRPDANIAPGFGNMDLKSNPYRQRILNLLGIKYVLHKDELMSGSFNPDYVTFPQDSYKLIWQKNPWQIYENKNVFPRFYLADNYEISNGKDKIISKIYDDKVNLQETLILEKDPKITLGKISKSNIEIVDYTPNKLNFKIKTDADSLFFISDNYFPGWKALIDGKEKEIYRANYSFRAIPIKQGEHRLEMYYFPESFITGLKISIIGVFLLIIYLILFKRIYER